MPVSYKSANSSVISLTSFSQPSLGALFCTSFLLASCGGSSSGPQTDLITVSPPSNPSNPAPQASPTLNSFYTLQKDVLPNFTSYYSNFSGYGGGLLFANTVTTTIDNKPTIIFFIHKTQTSVGSLVTTPVDNAQIILQRQADGKFTDVTYQLLGSSPYKLNGQAGDAVVFKTNFTNSNNPTIFIAGNAEDGRAIDNPNSKDTVVSQVQIPQTDGTYKTLNIGNPIFGGKGSMYALDEFVFVGDFKRTDANWRGSADSKIGTYYQPYYTYNADTQSFTHAGIAPTHPYGYEFLNKNTMFTTVTYFASHNSGPSGLAFALSAKVHGAWDLGAYTVPYEHVNLSFIDNSGRKVTVQDTYHYGYIIDGVSVFQPLLSVQGQFDFDNDGKVEIITGINANYAVPRGDGNFYEADFRAYTKLQFWNVVDNKIVPANIKLNGEVTALNQGNLQLVDVNNDKLMDIVINVWSDTGRPEVFLNMGSGNFNRVDPEKFPKSGMNYSGSLFHDLNNDGIMDLIYQPWGVKSNNSSDQPQIYYGNKPLTLSMNDTPAVNIDDYVVLPDLWQSTWNNDMTWA